MSSHAIGPDIPERSSWLASYVHVQTSGLLHGVVMGGYGTEAGWVLVGSGVLADAVVAGVAPVLVDNGTNVIRLVGDTAMDAIVLHGLSSQAADAGGRTRRDHGNNNKKRNDLTNNQKRKQMKQRRQYKNQSY